MTHFRRRRGSLGNCVPPCGGGGRRAGGAGAEPCSVQGGQRVLHRGRRLLAGRRLAVAFPDEFEGDPARLPDFTIQVVPSMTTRGRRLPLAAFPDRHRGWREGQPHPGSSCARTVAGPLAGMDRKPPGHGSGPVWPCRLTVQLQAAGLQRFGRRCVLAQFAPAAGAEPKIQRTCPSCPSQPRNGQWCHLPS